MTDTAKAPDGEALPLRLHWRQTWPDREADYVAEAPGQSKSVGRIMLIDGGPQQGMWEWAMHGFGPNNRIGTSHGVERSARAAAYMVEDAWFDLIRGSALHVPAPKRNAYEMAKAGE